MRSVVLALVLAAIAVTGCGGKSTAPQPNPGPSPSPSPSPTPSPTPPTGPGPTGAIPVTGSERIGWDQEIVAGGNIRDYEFTAFVDARRTTLPDVQCGTTAGPSGYSCSAQLPYMTDGQHTIKIAATRGVAGQDPMSDRSQEIVVIKGQAATAATADLPTSGIDFDGRVLEAVATHLSPVNDLAALPDGRIVVAEKSGIVRVLPIRSNDAAVITVVDGVSQAGGGLMAIAPHPAFSRNRLLYLLYAADTDRGVMYRLARGREVEGSLGQIAVLGDLAPAEPDGSGALRFGADGKLYMALSDLSADGAAPASYRGKMLRLDEDGRTPEDSSRASPVFSSGYARVSGVAPAPLAGAWFEAESGQEGRVHLVHRGITSSPGPEPLRRPFLNLPDSGGLLVYSGRAFSEWQGDLLVARLDGSGITRVPLKSTVPAPEPLTKLAGLFGRIRSLVEAADGSIYFGTANRGVDDASAARAQDDRVLRLRPLKAGS